MCKKVNMDNTFDPSDHNRPPRETGYQKETEQIIHRLRNRGDQRIGQLLINAVTKKHSGRIPSAKELVDFDKDVDDLTDDEMEEYLKRMSQAEAAQNAKVYDLIWSMEAPELLEALKTMDEKLNLG